MSAVAVSRDTADVVDPQLPPSARPRTRVESIDLLRGAVMILMALDHVRVFFHDAAYVHSPTDLGRTSAVLFFTRWATHYCAPTFVFLAGISACLYGARAGRKELSFFLATRGAWLVFVELFVLSLFRTFNPTYAYFNLQVIWTIGLSMIVLSALIYLDSRLLLLVSAVLIAGHNLLDGVHVAGDGLASFLWAVLHEARVFTLGRVTIRVMYPLLPWIGTLAAGYCFGRFYLADYDAARRRKILLWAGLGGTALFIVLRFANGYGDASPWSMRDTATFTVLSFLNVTKYPPSLLYLLMTLGPALTFLALTERSSNAVTAPVTVFGRVAMFYYLAHILLIHVAATVAAPLCGHDMMDMVLTSAPSDAPALKGYGFGLPTVYVVWLGLVLALYPCCRWYDRHKRRHQSTRWWLSYV
jgi:uncharacterized membrane protein